MSPCLLIGVLVSFGVVLHCIAGTNILELMFECRFFLSNMQIFQVVLVQTMAGDYSTVFLTPYREVT